MDNYIIMYDEDGSKLELEYLDTLCYEGEDYALFLDLDGCGVIFRCDPDGESYYGIDDQGFLGILLQLFKQKAAE